MDLSFWRVIGCWAMVKRLMTDTEGDRASLFFDLNIFWVRLLWTRSR
ncbi:MAG: hypothetical protein SAJ12_03915 [Jaaginema sp. PMC 1079.18]|nr:hypothetical protein [Jaaginema sp. PMC 1080.18]MEC4850134.1 hypothetical protein [Jaaginema sp. PMC 1079.18]